MSYSHEKSGLRGRAPRLAIIGGGQLGMFLCRAARELRVETVVVTPDPHAPAAAFAGQVIEASFESPGLAERVAQLADFVTFEFEAVPAALLEGLASQERQGRLRVRPGVAVLSLLKSKIRQKQWFAQHGYPTVPFCRTDDPCEEAGDLASRFGFPFVQKAAGGGYDGYGVQVIASAGQLTRLWNVPSVIEAYVEDPREISVVVARASRGESMAFHPVSMVFDSQRNVLDRVVSPSGLEQAVQDRATRLALDVVRALDGIGVFAVEMFLLSDNELVINEISPRVHNSGHHTLEAGAVSQFHQHVRAICDLPLVAPAQEAPQAVMRNLLYSDSLEFLLDYPAGPLTCDRDQVILHWYGKHEPRPGRKMGHMTCLCADSDEANRRMNRFIQRLRESPTGAAA